LATPRCRNKSQPHLAPERWVGGAVTIPSDAPIAIPI
jgi:hypothetical protein